MNNQLPRSSGAIRFLAGALLLVSLALFIVSKIYENTHPIWPWLAALSEAAMVGALADWFAVSALFRHPLGLPIPHTAIIPKNQGRIAGTLSRFVQDNFLDPESLAPRLQSAKLGQKLVSWLSDPIAAQTVAEQIKDLLRGILESMDNKEVTSFIAKALPALSAQMNLAPLSAEVLSSIREGDKDGKLFDEILKISERLLQKHKEILETLVSKELPWYIPGFIKHHLYAQVSEAVRRTMGAMQADRNHVLRQQLTHLVDRALKELRENIAWEQRLQDMVTALCERGTIVEYLGNLKGTLVERLRNDEQEIVTKSVVVAISFSAQAINKDEAITERLNQLLAQIMLRAVKDYGGRAGSFIEETMRAWDSKVLSSKIEAEVGRDLQFIRINGTVVGGLVGLLIHAVVTFVKSN